MLPIADRRPVASCSVSVYHPGLAVAMATPAAASTPYTLPGQLSSIQHHQQPYRPSSVSAGQPG